MDVITGVLACQKASKMRSKWFEGQRLKSNKEKHEHALNTGATPQLKVY